ncbi:MAG: hypothetical protein K8S15_08875 [Candidatus Aegiribacteria sp.]|nr:hypothetical protein [Candidatus Aegiribacteria sp.]
MLLLLMALIGITTTQPAILDQTDEEWTAPGYRVVEEAVINPLDYGEPIGWGENCNGPVASIGCQGFFIPTENGEKWRIIMLLKDRLVVLQEDEEVRDIPLTCSPRGIIYSRNGKYALIMGPVLDGSRESIYSREAEFVDIETGEVRTFEPLQNTGWTGFQFVNDDGSIFRWNNYNPYRLLEFYDPDFNLLCSTEIPIDMFTHFAHASDGSLILFASWNLLSAYDKYGTLLWEMELERGLPCPPLVNADGSIVLLATLHGLECHNGFTGELLWAKFDTQMNAPVPSVSRTGWASHIVHRGLAFGSDIQSMESINEMYYPTENWDHGVPVAVACNGSSLSISVCLPPLYQNHNLRKVIYTDSNGMILWVSSPYSVDSSSLIIHGPNNNLEYELTGNTLSIQSNGKRFIYSDYNQVLISRVEGCDEE